MTHNYLYILLAISLKRMPKCMIHGSGSGNPNIKVSKIMYEKFTIVENQQDLLCSLGEFALEMLDCCIYLKSTLISFEDRFGYKTWELKVIKQICKSINIQPNTHLYFL